MRTGLIGRFGSHVSVHTHTQTHTVVHRMMCVCVGSACVTEVTSVKDTILKSLIALVRFKYNTIN